VEEGAEIVGGDAGSVCLGEGEAASVEAVGAFDVFDEVAELLGEGEGAAELVVGHGAAGLRIDIAECNLRQVAATLGLGCAKLGLRQLGATRRVE